MKIIEKTKKFFGKAKSIWSHRKLLWLAAIFLIGLVLICSAAFILKGTPLIIALTVGGVLILISWGRMTFNAAVKRSIRLHEAEKLKEENRQLIERENILKQQLEESRNRKLQVLNVQPILELGIFEADCQITECFDLVFDKNGKIITDETDEEPEGFISAFLEVFLGQRKQRFIGTLTVKFTARYGIDMQNLKIRCDDNTKTVYIEGAESSYLGSKGFPETYWKGCITHREQGDEDWIADNEAARIESQCKDMCRNVMEESLKNGPKHLEWLKRPLQNTVKHLLKMMITPPGYSLVFVDKIEEESVLFFEYAAGLGLDKPKLGSGAD